MSEYKREFKVWPTAPTSGEKKGGKKAKKEPGVCTCAVCVCVCVCVCTVSLISSTLYIHQHTHTHTHIVTVADSPQILTDSTDPRLLKHKPLPTHVPIAKWGSEYSANFVSPVDIDYEGGAWKGAPRPDLYMKVRAYLW